MNPGPPTAPRPHANVHRENPKSQIGHHQNPNRNLHVMLFKTQTQISHAPPPQIKTQTHRLVLPMMDRRCWRWVWLRQCERDFFPWWIGFIKARSGRRWEKRRKGRKLTGLASECRWTSDLRWSMGWSYVSMSSVRRGGAEVSLMMSFGVCEEWPIQNSIEGKMEREIHLRHGNCKAYFTIKLISIFSLTIFSSGTKQTPKCKTFLDFSLHAKQTQL